MQPKKKSCSMPGFKLSAASVADIIILFDLIAVSMLVVSSCYTYLRDVLAEISASAIMGNSSL